MIGLLKFRELLGQAAHGLTDEDIEHIREIEYGLADAIFEAWLHERNELAIKSNPP